MGKARQRKGRTHFRVCVTREDTAGGASLSPLFHSFGRVTLSKSAAAKMSYGSSKSCLF